MRKIEKNAEPREWTKYRLTPGVDYQAIPELRDSLLEEQGYLCAYCMRRIPVRDKNSHEMSRIEHILSRESRPDQKLNYKNMIICCPGAITNDFHCDKNRRGADNITFNLFDEAFISTISYSSKNGSIKSSNAIYNTEMKDVLNLNHALLQKHRQQTLQGVTAVLSKKQVPWKKSEIRQILEQWQNKDEGKFNPYCGIVIWYLNKKIC